MTTPPTRLTTFELDRRVHRTLKHLAAVQGSSIRALISTAIDRFLADRAIAADLEEVNRRLRADRSRAREQPREQEDR